MKIGIFTDTYRPSINGIVYVTEILRRNFELLGHEVYIFAPASGLNKKADTPDDHIIRFPAVGGIPYDDFNASLFFPPSVLKQIDELKLDVIHFLTPGPVGLMGMYAAHKLDLPLVAEYCTDLFEYVEHYPIALPVIAGLGMALPFTFKVSREELLGIIKAYRPRLGIAKWNQETIRHLLNVMHSHCDTVISHSRKNADQMKSWQKSDEHYNIVIIPTGIDPLPKTTAKEVANFKKQWGIKPKDEVVLYVGRLSAEKNLDLLIDTMDELIRLRPNAKLVFVGDFDYRPMLEAHAKRSTAADRIVFTGKMPHEQLNKAYGAGNVFAFPSLTDTQSLALHEAALAGLPIVMIDEPVTEIVHQGVNGLFAQNNPADFAQKLSQVLADPKMQKQMGAASKKIAGRFTELKQAKKIVKIYQQIIRDRHKI